MDWTNSSYTWVGVHVFISYMIFLSTLTNFYLYQAFRRMLLSSIKECTQEEYMGFYIFRYNGKCVLKVEVLGILISLEKQEKRSTLVIDDGTATIRCIKYRDSSTTDYNNSSLVSDDIEYGDTVTVQGSLVKAETNDSPYDFMILAKCIEKVEDPNVEIFHWLCCVSEK